MSPLACRQCGNTDGPFTRDGLCEDCERLVPAGGEQ